MSDNISCNIINTKSWVDGDDYVVWYDFDFNGTDPYGIFILHMERSKASRRGMLRWFKWALSQGYNMYFCEGLEGVWRNHRELVGYFEDGKPVYRFKG